MEGENNGVRIDLSDLPNTEVTSKPPLVVSDFSRNVFSTKSSTSYLASASAPTISEEEARQAIDMLRGDDVSARVSAAYRLEGVAVALGEQRTREELLPFLADGFDDDDEVLSVIAKSIGSLVSHIGGIQYSHHLLPTLELLLTVEDPTVRENACYSSGIILQSSYTLDSFQQQYVAMLVRLSTKEWYTARCSACVLVSTGFNLFGDDGQNAVLSKYTILCQDDAPMVRRMAAKNLGILVSNYIERRGVTCLQRRNNVEDLLFTTLIPLYEDFASARQPDCVTLHTVHNCIAIGKALLAISRYHEKSSDLVTSIDVTNDEMKIISDLFSDRILPLIISSVDASSWRVRWTVASKFADVIATFALLSGAVVRLVPPYEKLLGDVEPEVKTAATLNLSKVARHISQTSTGSFEGGSSVLKLAKRVSFLAADDSENVRGALAMIITELAPILKKDNSITHLMPSVLLLFNDPSADVRLNIISSLDALHDTIGVDLLSQSLYPSIIELTKDGKWRIRLATIQHIHLLAKQFGKDYFSEKLTPICLSLLYDNICRVREAAAVNLRNLTEIFGGEWACTYLLPELSRMCCHASYLLRITAVQAFSHIATVADSQIVRAMILPALIEMASDDVPNVRLTIARGLETLTLKTDAYQIQIKAVLEILSQDSDKDVHYYAMKALRHCDQRHDEMKE